jgi:nitric oxide reductase NorQ protein
VREGAICYLDEVVEARQDTTVVIHPLADHRRQLSIDGSGRPLDAASGFCLVVSYNPGYRACSRTSRTRRASGWSPMSSASRPQMSRRRSSRTRPASTTTGGEAGLGPVRPSVALETTGLREVASTRVLIATGRLVAEGLSPREAARAAVAGPLTDDSTVTRGLVEMIDVYLVDQPA